MRCVKPGIGDHGTRPQLPRNQTTMYPTKEGINAAGTAKRPIPRPMLGMTGFMRV